MYIKACVMAPLLLLSLFACANNDVSTAVPPEMKDGIIAAAQQTPYAAIVKPISFAVLEQKGSDSTDSYSERQVLFKAHVLETLRGIDYKVIEYYQWIENGEEVYEEQSPIVVFLCIDKENRFYYPGLGTQFPSSKLIIDIAKTAINLTKSNPSQFEFCD